MAEWHNKILNTQQPCTLNYDTTTVYFVFTRLHPLVFKFCAACYVFLQLQVYMSTCSSMLDQDRHYYNIMRIYHSSCLIHCHWVQDPIVAKLNFLFTGYVWSIISCPKLVDQLAEVPSSRDCCMPLPGCPQYMPLVWSITSSTTGASWPLKGEKEHVSFSMSPSRILWLRKRMNPGNAGACISYCPTQLGTTLSNRVESWASCCPTPLDTVA